MRQFSGALLMFALLSACRPALMEMPQAPSVTTDVGRQCVQQRCQALYNVCLGETAAYGPDPSPSGCEGESEKRRAINACRENLGGCYGTCPP